LIDRLLGQDGRAMTLAKRAWLLQFTQAPVRGGSKLSNCRGKEGAVKTKANAEWVLAQVHGC
jgi:hypothetical protein